MTKKFTTYGNFSLCAEIGNLFAKACKGLQLEATVCTRNSLISSSEILHSTKRKKVKSWKMYLYVFIQVLTRSGSERRKKSIEEKRYVLITGLR